MCQPLNVCAYVHAQFVMHVARGNGLEWRAAAQCGSCNVKECACHVHMRVMLGVLVCLRDSYNCHYDDGPFDEALGKSSTSLSPSSSRAHASRTNKAYDTNIGHMSNALKLPVRCANSRFKRPLHTHTHTIRARLCARHQLKCHGFVRQHTHSTQ